MTLNGVMVLILRYFTEFGSFRGTLQKAVEDTINFLRRNVAQSKLIYVLAMHHL